MFPSRNVKYFPVEREAYSIGKGKHSSVEMGNIGKYGWEILSPGTKQYFLIGMKKVSHQE